ncbi:DNA polymerase II [Puteibacter caeruleilacunae]|nr:DNA polymerase II [Puteibacter caeruleilacunae]
MTDKNQAQHAMDLAEDSRQKDWHHPSFVSELFNGRFRWELITPFPEQDASDKKIGDEFLLKVKACLTEYIDPDEVDRSEKLSDEAIAALKEIGCFRMKIPKEYGGLGLSLFNYARVISFISTYCGSTAVWLSAHQSIGVPQPLKLFGTPAQKEKYLKMISDGAISAFALTEPGVGSDPARMDTKAELSEDGQHYILNGQKLWCTNGPDADVIIIMALTKPKIVRGKEKKQISAFILEMDTPGIATDHNCSFMGIRGISNGQLSFKDVKVPVENLIGEEGEGLKIAFATLNDGRLIIPAVSAAAGKACLRICRDWASERVQWGSAIGQHQAVASMLSDIAVETYAMQNVSKLSIALATQQRVDIRLEAAMAKYFGSEAVWRVVDQTLQVRGGRGYETAESLRARGELGAPVERMMRDLRINRIIEGSSEIMRLFIAREAVDRHFKLAMPMLKARTISDRLKAFGKILKYYTLWYPSVWLPSFKRLKTVQLNSVNRKHLNYIRKTSRKLARRLFHSMARYQQEMQNEQIILGHYVDIGVLLFAMSACLARADRATVAEDKLKDEQHLADVYCINSREQIESYFKAIKKEKRKAKVQVSNNLLAGKYAWMEKDIFQNGETTI